MPAQTATDVQHMIDGSDFSVTATTQQGDKVTGLYIRRAGGALDYNDNRHRLIVTRTVADTIALGTTLTINGISYTVREKEPDDHVVNLVLEST
jgi:hypothetical protein